MAQLSDKQKELNKLRRFVSKRAPGAKVSGRVGEQGQVVYSIVDGDGKSLINQELLLPPATSAFQAWQQAKYCIWFTNMIRKSNTAFNEERMYKNLEQGRYHG